MQDNAGFQPINDRAPAGGGSLAAQMFCSCSSLAAHRSGSSLRVRMVGGNTLSGIFHSTSRWRFVHRLAIIPRPGTFPAEKPLQPHSIWASPPGMQFAKTDVANCPTAFLIAARDT